MELVCSGTLLVGEGVVPMTAVKAKMRNGVDSIAAWKSKERM